MEQFNISFSHSIFTVTAFQERVLIAMITLIAIAVLQGVLYAVVPHKCGIRPVMEALSDMILSPMIAKLNRRYRSKKALFVRGAIVFAVVLFITFVLIWLMQKGLTLWGASLSDDASVPYHMYDDVLFLALCLSPVWPLLIIARFGRLDHKDQKSKNNVLFLALARASYSNLIHHDESGLRRHAIKMLVMSFMFHVLIPITVYIALGVWALLLYTGLYTVINCAGRHLYGGLFTWFSKMFLLPLLYVMQWGAAFIMYFASFLTGTTKLAKNTALIFKVSHLKANHVFEGGVALGIMALALDKTLGGPYKDRNGEAVPAQWVGRSDATAQLSGKDIYRALYTVFVAQVMLLLLLCALYLYFA